MAIANAAQALLSAAYAQRIVAVVLENPPSSVRDLIANQRKNQPGILYDTITALAGLQVGQDFYQCAPVVVAKNLLRPTLVQIARSDNLVSVAMAESVFKSLSTGFPHRFQIYPHGAHAAIWNGQPVQFEADFKQIWQTGLQWRTQNKTQMISQGAAPL
jgi:fermentation-respiration switch protein FrsA (DUF1100 family)